MVRRILILGGTGDARKLADRLVGDGHDVTSSLAGVTSQPMLPAGEIHLGGFGGADGLANYIRDGRFELLIDATHPFAAQISGNAVNAARAADIGLVRFERPPWEPADDDNWISVANTNAAINQIDRSATAFVTIGRKEIGQFAARPDVKVVARMIEAPGETLPDHWRIILARPPFSVDDEMALMRDEGVDVVVSKNAGGPARAKLDAARQLGLPVIMIERPVNSPAETVATIEEAVRLAAGEGK